MNKQKPLTKDEILASLLFEDDNISEISDNASVEAAQSEEYLADCTVSDAALREVHARPTQYPSTEKFDCVGYIHHSAPEESDLNKLSSSSSDSDEWLPHCKRRLKRKNKYYPKKTITKKSGIKMSSSHRKNRAFNEEADNTEMSAFEAERNKNIAEKMKLFHMLQLDNAKKEIEKLSHHPKKARVSVPTNDNSTSREKYPRQVKVQKQSYYPTLTMKKETVDVVAENENTNPHFASQKVVNMPDLIYKPFNNTDFSEYFERLKNSLESRENLIKNDFDDKTCPLEFLETKMEKLTLRNEHNVKVLPNHISALAFHPSETVTLLAAGGKTGVLGLWNVNIVAGDWDDSNILVFELHSAPISSVCFNKFEKHILYTTSLDGVLCRADLNTQIFEAVYSIRDQIRGAAGLTWLCELDQHVLLVAQESGFVAQVDVRTKDCTAKQLSRCHHDTVRTVSLKNHNNIVTCSDDGSVSMWDLRFMRQQGVADQVWTFKPNKSAVSAFVSPVTGNRLLVTLPCNSVYIYEIQSSGAPFRSWVVRRRGSCSTRPSQYPFKAVWHPKREDFFCISRNYMPYGIDLYGCGYTMMPLGSPRKCVHLETQRCTVAGFHPHHTAVAGACLTKVHLFL